MTKIKKNNENKNKIILPFVVIMNTWWSAAMKSTWGSFLRSIGEDLIEETSPKGTSTEEMSPKGTSSDDVSQLVCKVVIGYFGRHFDKFNRAPGSRTPPARVTQNPVFVSTNWPADVLSRTRDCLSAPLHIIIVRNGLLISPGPKHN